MRKLSWDDFDSCLSQITLACRGKQFSGVYGFPRGGLCMSVAISHLLTIPFLNEPIPNSLIVDDVYDTGFTLNKIKNLSGITVFVWFSKVEPVWWNAVEVCDPSEWLVFPWENPLLAVKEEQSFQLRRGKA